MNRTLRISACALVAAPLVAALALRMPPAHAQGAPPAATVEPLHFHHVHVNSTDPKAAAAYYPKAFTVSATKTTFNGYEAVKTGNVYVLFTKVNATPQNELTGPQTSVWHFGWNTPDSRKYNERFRAYKKRNLEAAVAHIVAHLRRHPRHAVWINLDSDNYINPWFKERQWYDYNPQTLRQFREWLTGSGPYASGATLAGEGLAPSLDLPGINRLAKGQWTALAEVDAPRGPLVADDPWYQVWIRFKRHLVARHYGDLADWACAAGLPPDHIYTAVGIADRTVAKNFDDPIRGWNDQSGVSLAGGKPRCGHLGVVMYGPVTRNAAPAPFAAAAAVPAAGPALASVPESPARGSAPACRRSSRRPAWLCP